jgi:putative AdoMet-dependent methyltransferase
MGREFLPIFKDWAKDYDHAVLGRDPEYNEVFSRYDELLEKIVAASGHSVLEFGSGTGNLTKKIIQAELKVIAVEPSYEMRQIAQSKAELKDVLFMDGDMENFPVLARPIDTIVSSFVFHHLTLLEKERAVLKYASLLKSGGKVIFGDTLFLSETHLTRAIQKAKDQSFFNLAADLEREYYPLIQDVEQIFFDAGFSTRFEQINDFVWIVEAEKK